MAMTKERKDEILVLLNKGETNSAIREIVDAIEDFGNQPVMNERLLGAIVNLLERVEKLEKKLGLQGAD